MTGILKALLTNRRGLAFLIPLLTFILNQSGIAANDTQVTDIATQASGLISGLLALWSLYKPKPQAG